MKDQRGDWTWSEVIFRREYLVPILFTLGVCGILKYEGCTARKKYFPETRSELLNKVYRAADTNYNGNLEDPEVFQLGKDLGVVRDFPDWVPETQRVVTKDGVLFDIDSSVPLERLEDYLKIREIQKKPSDTSRSF